MAVNLYEGFSNTITGETFRCVDYTSEAFVFEWTVAPNGYVPFEHVHLNQAEIFHVKAGEIKILLEGKEYIGKPGDTIIVPPGKRHIAYNNKPETLSCVVEYTPGLDTYTFFQCFAGLTIDQDVDKQGKINIAKMLYFARKMNTRSMARPTSIPAPILNLVANLAFVMGSLLGWVKLYARYTGKQK